MDKDKEKISFTGEFTSRCRCSFLPRSIPLRPLKSPRSPLAMTDQSHAVATNTTQPSATLAHIHRAILKEIKQAPSVKTIAQIQTPQYKVDQRFYLSIWD